MRYVCCLISILLLNACSVRLINPLGTNNSASSGSSNSSSSILSISDASHYSFGSVQVGSGVNHTFTVTNSGSVTASSLSGSGLSSDLSFLGGSYPGTGGTCGASLNAGASCTMVVKYLPSSAGTIANQNLTVSYSASGTSSSAVRTVSGTGVTPAGTYSSDFVAGSQAGNNDTGVKVVVDTQDNTYLAARHVGVITIDGTTITPNNLTNSASLIRKANSSGQTQWLRSFSSTTAVSTICGNIALDPTESYLYLGCVYYATVDFGSGYNFTSNGGVNGDWAILKLDGSTGNTIWALTFGGPNTDSMGDLTVSPNGNVYAAGSVNSTVNFGGGNISYSAAADQAFAKFDSNGNHLLSFGYGSAATDFIAQIVVDASENIYICGSHAAAINHGCGALAYSGGAGYDYNIAKFNSAGVCQWSKAAGISAVQDSCQGLAYDSSGNVYAAGLYRGNTFNLGGGNLAFNTGAEGFLVKYNSSGVWQWNQVLTGTGTEMISNPVIDTDNLNEYIVITGEYDSASASFMTNTLNNASGGTNDFFVAKLTTAGALSWHQTYGGTAADSTGATGISRAGFIYVPGSFASSPITFGSNNYNTTGGNDIFMLKLYP